MAAKDHGGVKAMAILFDRAESEGKFAPRASEPQPQTLSLDCPNKLILNITVCLTLITLTLTLNCASILHGTGAWTRTGCASRMRRHDTVSSGASADLFPRGMPTANTEMLKGVRLRGGPSMRCVLGYPADRPRALGARCRLAPRCSCKKKKPHSRSCERSRRGRPGSRHRGQRRLPERGSQFANTSEHADGEHRRRASIGRLPGSDSSPVEFVQQCLPPAPPPSADSLADRRRQYSQDFREKQVSRVHDLRITRRRASAGI